MNKEKTMRLGSEIYRNVQCHSKLACRPQTRTAKRCPCTIVCARRGLSMRAHGSSCDLRKNERTMRLYIGCEYISGCKGMNHGARADNFFFSSNDKERRADDAPVVECWRLDYKHFLDTSVTKPREFCLRRRRDQGEAGPFENSQ